MSEAAHSLQILELDGLWHVFLGRSVGMVPKSLGKAWWSICFFSVRLVTGMRNGSEPIMVKLLKEIMMGISITQGIMYLPPILYIPTLFDTVCKVSMCKPELPQKES